jgi:hypothetical protein
MLKLNPEKRTFENLIQSELKAENLLERYDFQSAMIKSWETIKNEIGLPNSYLIGQEINPHKSVGNAIDLLAFNADDSSLVIIELKRDKNKLQLLQALSYAAMVAKWDKEVLIHSVQRDINPETTELIELIEDSELSDEVSIILISEYYDPEVIITAEWLTNNYGVDITAFAVRILKLENQIFVQFDQRLPLKELDDVYEKRGRRKRNKTNSDLTWEDLLPKFKYSFASKALEYCRATNEGDPTRRRFGTFRKNHDGFDRISINFRGKYLNIYTRDDLQEGDSIIKSKFSNPMEILDWRNGHSFKIHTEKEFEELKKWLK